MIIEGDPRAAVLSNGTKPDYFVGHVDEFNNDWIWHQNLLLPPGTHHLTVTHKGKTVWSGDVNVAANKKDRHLPEQERHAEDGRLEARRETEGSAALQGRHRQRPGRGRAGNG